MSPRIIYSGDVVLLDEDSKNLFYSRRKIIWQRNTLIQDLMVSPWHVVRPSRRSQTSVLLTQKLGLVDSSSGLSATTVTATRSSSLIRPRSKPAGPDSSRNSGPLPYYFFFLYICSFINSISLNRSFRFSFRFQTASSLNTPALMLGIILFS